MLPHSLKPVVFAGVGFVLVLRRIVPLQDSVRFVSGSRCDVCQFEWHRTLACFALKNSVEVSAIAGDCELSGFLSACVL